jgi:rhamnosyltransferase
MNVCAIIVTYHPELDELEHSIARLRSQVDALVLIDNASGELACEAIRLMAKKYDGQLIENSSNVGIAQALNQGVREAIRRGAQFVLFFDQDSGVSPDFVEQELLCYSESSSKKKVGLVSPLIVNPVTKRMHGPIPGADGELLLAQTSGALMPIEVFADVGYFVDELFIDWADYEHCMRMSLKGWHIAFADRAKLDHLAGGNLPINFFGWHTYTLNATPIRYYYRTRNCIWTAKRYYRAFPSIIFRFLRRMVWQWVKVLMVEGDRLVKLRANLLGVWDGIGNRMGKRVL